MLFLAIFWPSVSSGGKSIPTSHFIFLVMIFKVIFNNLCEGQLNVIFRLVIIAVAKLMPCKKKFLGNIRIAAKSLK